MPDHRINIFDYRTEIEKEIEEEESTLDWLENVLDIELLESTKTESTIAKILIGYGGPTIWIVLDSQWGHRLTHSWGMDADKRDTQEVEFDKELGDQMLEMIEEIYAT
tara:strand:+ start:436 stop:759 length:324 start_codon:yes stop_codon:yes gene_type:complete